MLHDSTWSPQRNRQEHWFNDNIILARAQHWQTFCMSVDELQSQSTMISCTFKFLSGLVSSFSDVDTKKGMKWHDSVLAGLSLDIVINRLLCSSFVSSGAVSMIIQDIELITNILLQNYPHVHCLLLVFIQSKHVQHKYGGVRSADRINEHIAIASRFWIERFVPPPRFHLLLC